MSGTLWRGRSVSAGARRVFAPFEHLGGVRVHAVGAGSLEFLTAVAARLEPDAERSGPPRREHVPYAVADDHRVPVNLLLSDGAKVDTAATPTAVTLTRWKFALVTSDTVAVPAGTAIGSEH